MSKNIYIAIIGLLVVVGCKDSFDMDDLHEETKLVLNCFPIIRRTASTTAIWR